MTAENFTQVEPSGIPLALLVDPDIDSRDLYAFALQRDRWRVEVAGDGDEGYVRAVDLRPDVVVTELMMPGVDGYELCRRLKSDPATCDIPVVVVTASALPREVEQAGQAGGDIILCKPCRPDELTGVLQRLVEQSRVVRAASRESRSRARAATTRANDVRDRLGRFDGFKRS